MSIEDGEVLRLCPAKLRDEDNRMASQYMGIPALGPPISISRDRLGEELLKRKDPKELSCPDDCPGKVVKQRRLLGVIPLPSVEICPMNPDAPTRNPFGF